jgi:hypothetical protein
MNKMNPKIKAKWVAALRSGEYKQGKVCLRQVDGGFCCLGVLTDLAVRVGVGAWKPPVDNAYFFDCDSGMLPEKVSEWAGFVYPARMGGEVIIDGIVDMLAGHNDDGKTFAQIADAIEAQL